jgi:hypothetical protein
MFIVGAVITRFGTINAVPAILFLRTLVAAWGFEKVGCALSVTSLSESLVHLKNRLFLRQAFITVNIRH